MERLEGVHELLYDAIEKLHEVEEKTDDATLRNYLKLVRELLCIANGFLMALDELKPCEHICCPECGCSEFNAVCLSCGHVWTIRGE